MPEPETDEFYHQDLIGLRVERTDGVTVGTIKGVENYGAGPLLEIETVPDIPDLETIALVPFTREAVPEVDLGAGFIVIDPVPGILTVPQDDEVDDDGPQEDNVNDDVNDGGEGKERG